MSEKLRVLIAHNRYQQKGGEDGVVVNESRLLESNGHPVHVFEVDNDHIHGLVAKIKAAWDCVYSEASKRKMAEAILEFKPDIVHAHNVFPSLSSSIFDACSEAGVPFVRSLHNYRLVCPSGSAYRDGHVCEDCMGKSFGWPGVKHACYRDSRLGTFTVALATKNERERSIRLGRTTHAIASLTDFGLQKLKEVGPPNLKLYPKPNFLYPDPGPGRGEGGYFLFVGRLVGEKGIPFLLDAWTRLGIQSPLKIVGGGPLSPECEKAAAASPFIEYLGAQPKEKTYELIANAYALVFPSEWYEGFPLTIVEALAMGTPIIAADLGAMSVVIRPGINGLHFRSKDSESFASQVRWLVNNPESARSMRGSARADFEANYTAEINYATLVRIYEQVIEANRS